MRATSFQGPRRPADTRLAVTAKVAAALVSGATPRVAAMNSTAVGSTKGARDQANPTTVAAAARVPRATAGHRSRSIRARPSRLVATQARIALPMVSTPRASPAQNVPKEATQSPSKAGALVVAPIVAPTSGPARTAYARSRTACRGEDRSTSSSLRRTRAAPTQGSTVLATAKPIAAAPVSPCARSRLTSTAAAAARIQGQCRRCVEIRAADVTPAGAKNAGAAMASAPVARAGYNAWKQNRAVIVTGGRNAFQAGLVKFIPRKTLLRMVRNIQSPAT